MKGDICMDVTQKTANHLKEQRGKVFTTKAMVVISFLSTLSYVLMLLESPPFIGFLRLELSDIPALVGAFHFGPMAGLIIELIKNLIKAITATKTAGIGELANFLISVAYVVPAAYFYRKLSGKYSAFISYLIATISMAVVGILVNYFITVPLFAALYGGMDNVLSAATVIPGIKDKLTLILYGITPFNIVKGIFMGVVSYFTFKLVKQRI